MREIAKAFSKTVSGTAVSLLINTISVKILATQLGPGGMGLYGLLRQIHSTTLIAATMGGQTALVQGGSSKEGEDREAYLKTVLVLFLASGLLASGVLILLAPVLAAQFLKRQDPLAVNLIRALALPVFLTVLTSYGMGVLNIHRALGYMASIQAATALVTLALSYPVAMAVKSGQEVALIGLMSATQTITLGLLLWWLLRQQVLKELVGNISQNFDKKAARYFFSFAGVTVLTSLLNSAMVLTLRGVIVQKYELTGVGIFDAAWTLCVTYISLITSAFGTYYLPTLSKLTDKQDIRDLIQKVLLFTAVVSTVVIVVLTLLKKELIVLLFSAEFTPSLNLLRWLLIADYIKLLSWVLAFPMLAFSHLRVYFISELLSNLGLLGVCYWSLENSSSLEGIGIAVLTLYSCYLFFTLWFVWRYYLFLPTLKTALASGFGLVAVVGAAGYSWHNI